MGQLKKVLLLTNSITETEINEIKKSLLENDHYALNLSLVHIIPSLPACYFNIPSMVLLAERYYEEAKKTLIYIGNNLGIQEKDQWLMSGKIRHEVLRLAAKLNVNYILAGSTSLPDLHRSFWFKSKTYATPIKSIHNSGISL